MIFNSKTIISKRKSIYLTIGSVATVISAYYYGDTIIKYFVNGNKLIKKNSKNSEKSSKDDEYIYVSYDVNDSFDDDTIGSLRVSSGAISSHWQLLRLSQYAKDHIIKNLAIKTLANGKFNDYQCREIAQSCDCETSVSLARTHNVNLKLFLPLIKPNYYVESSETRKSVIFPPYFDFEKVLSIILNDASSLNSNCSECTKYFTNFALRILSEQMKLHEIPQPLDTDHIHRHQRSNPTKAYYIYLQALLENASCGAKSCESLVNNGIFLVLAYLKQKFPDVKVQNRIAQILAKLSVHRDLHEHFWVTNWIGVLAQWTVSDNFELRLTASKILHNLSEESCGLLNDPIYILHPLYRDIISRDFDLIFVHGLLGGVFRTWRQSDTEKESDDYTQCWPQSWIPHDIDNVRILAVNYQTYLSDWNFECPGDKYTLKDRSSQLLAHLITTNVGEKPIIWVTHSMGGLLVKQMLNDLSDADDPIAKKILRQTKGVIFYSVPHRGTEIAVWTPRVQKIIAPSTEVLELRKDSPFLLSLHQNFLKLVDDYGIKCLSFGESLKSKVGLKSVKWNALLVPEESSDPGIGKFHILPVDHYSICKPENRHSPAYAIALKFIKRIIRDNDIHKENVPSSNKSFNEVFFHHIFLNK